MLIASFSNETKIDVKLYRKHLHITGLAEDDLEMLKRVVDNAKRYYTNPKVYDDVWSEENGDEELSIRSQ